METKRIAAWDNIKWFAILLVVMGHFVEPLAGKSTVYQGLFCFIYAFHMPLFIFISGLFHKDTRISQKVCSYLGIYVVSKVFDYIPDALFMDKYYLSLLKAKNIPWYMLAMAVYILLTYAFRNCDKKALFVVFFLMGLFITYDTVLYKGDLPDYFAISRVIVFYPFYLLGVLLTDYKTKMVKLFENKWVKFIGVCIVLAWLLICLGNIEFVYKYRPLFTGRNRISSDWAFLYRLANYLIATVVGFGFMAAIPTRNLGHITTFGSRTLQVYLWHILLQSILITSGVWDTVFGVNAYMKVVWLLIPIPLTLFLSLKIFRQPTDFLMKAPRGLSKKQETK